MLPIFEKNLYNIVFVDYENKTANIVETAYGDMVALPDVEPVEGKHFIGWDAECFKYAEDGDVDAEIFNSREETPYYKTTDGSYILITDYDNQVHNLVDDTEYYKYFSDSNSIVKESKVVKIGGATLTTTSLFRLMVVPP